MTVVLRENDWAKQMIESHSLGKKPSETLRRVARYYIDKGYATKDVRTQLNSFLLRCDSGTSIPKWQDMLDYAVSSASKYRSINIDSISISDAEMKRIDALDGKQIRRLAFTLLCLAKYWEVVIPGGGYWVNNKDNEIMALANINTSIKRQSAMYWSLREAGMIQFSRRVDNTNVKVCFVEDGEPVLHITDFRNLGYQYLMCHGEPYFECTSCGITTKIRDPENKRRQKYCTECAAKMRIKQNVEAVMRYRNIEKT